MYSTYLETKGTAHSLASLTYTNLKKQKTAWLVFTSTVELLQVINIKKQNIAEPDPIVTEEDR